MRLPIFRRVSNNKSFDDGLYFEMGASEVIKDGKRKMKEKLPKVHGVQMNKVDPNPINNISSSINPIPPFGVKDSISQEEPTMRRKHFRYEL